MTPLSDAYPSAPVLAELEQLLRQPDDDRRAAQAWRLICHATPHSDFGVVQDFALEHNLITAPSSEPMRTEQGPRWPGAWRNPCDGSEMVWIPPGPFLVGPEPIRPNVKPKEAVVPGFSLARHPTTNAQFKRFLDETGYRPAAWHPRNDLFLAHWVKGAPRDTELDHPVTWVSFVDALFYGRWAGLTLPTEWLWEKAARGPDGRPYPWGKELTVETAEVLVNVASDGTTPVGDYPRTRSVYGCEDMIGNVAEWCQMTPRDDPQAIPLPFRAPEEPTNPLAIVLAAVRGSCFLRSDPGRMTAWHRRRLSTTRRNAWVGFRPACLLPFQPVRRRPGEHPPPGVIQSTCLSPR